MRFSPVVIVCLIALGGCGGSDATSGTAISAPATSAPATSVALTTTTTGANTPTPTDRQNAYFYAVLPYDKGVVALKTSTDNTFAGKRAFCAALAPLSGEFTKAIGEYRGWGDAQSQIDTLIAASGEATRLQSACASAATEVELDEMMHELAAAMTNNDLAVSAVRSKIGLPALDG